MNIKFQSVMNIVSEDFLAQGRLTIHGQSPWISKKG